jgi:hypothetical protein
LFTKKSSWQAKQSVLHTTVTFYCDCIKMCEYFTPNWLFNNNNAQSHTSFLTRECFTKNNITVVPHPHCFSLFPRLKIKLKGRHFDTIEVTKAESQAVCSATSQITTSRMHFEDDRSSGNGANVRGRELLPGWWWPVGPKLVFDQMASLVPEIMDGCV